MGGYEASWRTSMGSEYTRTEESSGSFSLRRRKRKPRKEESSKDEENYKKEVSRSTNLTIHDVLLFKDFIRTHLGGTEIPSESPLSRKIEKT